MASSPSKYSLVITQSFIKDLKNIDRPEQVRIRKALNDILADPYKGRKVVSAEIGLYRWRVGNYRIRYDINYGEVIILRVMKREEVYQED